MQMQASDWLIISLSYKHTHSHSLSKKHESLCQFKPQHVDTRQNCTLFLLTHIPSQFSLSFQNNIIKNIFNIFQITVDLQSIDTKGQNLSGFICEVRPSTSRKANRKIFFFFSLSYHMTEITMKLFKATSFLSVWTLKKKRQWNLERSTVSTQRGRSDRPFMNTNTSH